MRGVGPENRAFRGILLDKGIVVRDVRAVGRSLIVSYKEQAKLFASGEVAGYAGPVGGDGLRYRSVLREGKVGGGGGQG